MRLAENGHSQSKRARGRYLQTAVNTVRDASERANAVHLLADCSGTAYIPSLQMHSRKPIHVLVSPPIGINMHCFPHLASTTSRLPVKPAPDGRVTGQSPHPGERSFTTEHSRHFTWRTTNTCPNEPVSAPYHSRLANPA